MAENHGEGIIRVYMSWLEYKILAKASRSAVSKASKPILGKYDEFYERLWTKEREK